ncbi:hypothetical protein Tco_1578698, partial [Tanacetum coccineum]
MILWAMEMEHCLEYIDMMFGRVLPPVSAAKIHAVEKERKARTILLMAIPKDHLRRFHGMDDAEKIWEAMRRGYGVMQIQRRCSESSWSNLAMTMRTKPHVDTLSIDDLYNNLRVFGAGSNKYHNSSASSQYVALFHTARVATNKDMDIEEMDINWQIEMIAIRMKKFYKKTGRRVQIDGRKPVGFDKKKLECFKCHNTDHFAREFEEVETNHALMAISSNNEVSLCSKTYTDSYNKLKTLCDEQTNQLGEQEAKILAYTLAVKKLEAQVVTFQKQQLSLNEQLTFKANEIYEKDEKLKKYRRIGMKAVKEREQLQKIVDSWKNSSKNLWKLVDSGMTSNSKVGLGYEIQSNNEVLSYEEEMNRTVFKCTEEDFLNKPLYSRFSKT